uniref:DJ-1/PfpI domain-containing protein n=1 Tax=Chromera velia CCMP2878 TaxID=1169474 RepID=A0A0G4IED0_9ALVE|eukprot:Cvel_2397.t1-p1 / transcript=Cvel_2397.t1 / gene=Cvel_2397 / organism=Chromera_velia_CCMP2878 / gene_product=Protein DJ-1 homolog B, putative / transcript_product=Protein DJ-1 homolog B, putative / location=Cvel_scaffold93:89376-92390(-) / protein_length=186 / sequence_SO=supercontig / SO=protein_coding / is_pseudo=false
MSKKVLVPIADGTEEIEAVCIIDTLRRAGAEVTVASVMEGRKQVKASRGVGLVADALISECVEGHTWDLIACPGGMPGAEHLRDCAPLVDLLKKQKAEGRIYAAVCASPAVVFEAHGLLEGEKATSYPAFQGKLSNLAEGRVVVSNKCVTSQGPGTSLEFALKLAEVLFGEKVAKKHEAAMLVQVV